jgi:hypothetical protein
MAPVGFDEVVEQWKREQWIRLGWSVDEAVLLASELDYHDVEKLIARGCEPELALRIVR